jgi:hypothetical protein
MNKAELAQAIEALTGKPVDPGAFTKEQLEQMLAEAQAAADTSDTDNQPSESSSDEPAESDTNVSTVRVRLGEKAPAGALIVGAVRITRDEPGVISQEDYDHLAGPYYLEIVD